MAVSGMTSSSLRTHGQPPMGTGSLEWSAPRAGTRRRWTSARRGGDKDGRAVDRISTGGTGGLTSTTDAETCTI